MSSCDLETSIAIVGHTVMIGVGATAAMDIWATLLWRCFQVASLDYALLGRWIGHFAQGRFTHDRIGDTPPVRHEHVIGLSAHYIIGVVFAALLVACWGREWLNRPTLLPPLIVSSATLVAPFFVMQPAMGAGYLASKTPRPHIARLRTVVTHTVYGLGLYISARIWLPLPFNAPIVIR